MQPFDIFQQFATDDNAEVNGVWFKGSGDAEFLIARAQNRRYQRALAKKLEENEHLLKAQTDEADQRSEVVMAEIYADSILLGWRGSVAYKGKVVEYSRAQAVELLTHKEFRKWVARKSEDVDAYRAKLEVEQGNA